MLKSTEYGNNSNSIRFLQVLKTKVFSKLIDFCTLNNYYSSVLKKITCLTESYIQCQIFVGMKHVVTQIYHAILEPPLVSYYQYCSYNYSVVALVQLTDTTTDCDCLLPIGRRLNKIGCGSNSSGCDSRRSLSRALVIYRLLDGQCPDRTLYTIIRTDQRDSTIMITATVMFLCWQRYYQ